jgi:beta-N-acetylhexosaminidase
MSGELERLAAACIFPGFDGTEVPDWIRSWLDRGLGGVVLFARNVESPEQLAELTRALRAGQPRLLVATDEEGGDVTRLEAEAGSSYPGNCALGVVDDVALTEEVAAALGDDLSRAGVNVNLAPVADLATNPRNPIVGVRSFGSDPALVSRHVAAFVRGLQGVGVAACAKHFPGHGDTEEDSHVALPEVTSDRDTIFAQALPPFRAAVEADVRAIMTAHIRVPALDDLPATVSHTILHGLLREELGFDGLVITDALEMQGLAGSVGIEEGAVLAVAAGADALCLGAVLGDDDASSILAALVDAVAAGRLAEERLREAARRVDAVARWAAEERRPSPAARESGLEAARRAVFVEGGLGLVRAPLVVEVRAEPSIAAGKAGRGFGEALRRRVPETEVVELGDDGSDPLAGRPDRQLVLVVRDAHRHSWARAAAARLVARAGDAVVVETGLPVWGPDRAAGYVATYGAGRVNLEAAAERLGAPS